MLNKVRQLKASKGFTLIELMIVVAIVGILAAVGLPAYGDYIARSQVTEGVSLVGGAKVGVEEWAQNEGSLTGADGGVGTIPADGAVKGRYGTLTSTASGVITFTFASGGGANAEAKTELGGKVLVFSPTLDVATNVIVWNCNAAAGTDINSKYLPKVCQ